MAKPARRRPWLEWTTGALGAAIFAATLAVLSFEASRDTDDAPDVAATVEAIQRVGDGHVVRFVVRNSGKVTAMNLTLTAQLDVAGGEPERHSVMLDYVPPRSERRGGFFFVSDPRRGQLEIRAVAYVEP